MSEGIQLTPKKVQLLGIQFTLYNLEQLLETIEAIIESDHKGLILSGNVHSFNLAYQHDWLRTFLNRATIVRIDGAGLRLGVKLLGYKTPCRITWADFAWDLADFAELRGYTFFFLGGSPSVADKAALRFKERFSNIRIVGTHHGYFDRGFGNSENEAVIREINAVKPHLLIVGFGMPLQERWLMENWERLEANITLTGGAVFDYVSGKLHRPPRWMTNHGLEWLGRLIIEPRRLWRRYLIGNPLFLWRVLKQRLGLLHFE